MRSLGGIPAEKLVRAISRERDRDMGSRQASEREGRKARRIGEGFVEDVGRLVEETRDVVAADENLAVMGPQSRRDVGGMASLVVGRLVEADGERRHRGPRVLGRK